MNVRVTPKRSGKPGWEVDIRFVWPNGQRHRERCASPVLGKRASRQWALARGAAMFAAGPPKPPEQETATVTLPSAILPWPNTPGVYFVRAGDKVKIGRASSVERRLCELQTGASEPLRLLAVVSGADAEERAYHAQFASLRRTGEWFELGLPIVLEIARIRAGRCEGTSSCPLAPPEK